MIIFNIRKVLLFRGRIKRPGALIRNPALARTLKIISKKPLDFYRGRIAKAIVFDIQNLGGILTLEDLRYYKVMWQKPMSVSIKRGITAYMPSHNSGGPSLTFILQMLKCKMLK